MRTKWAVFLIFFAYVMALAALTAPARAETEAVRLPALMYHHVSEDESARGDYVIYPGGARGGSCAGLDETATRPA